MVLSAHEQQTWEEFERLYDLDGVEPPRLDPAIGERGDGGIPGVDDMPVVVVAGSWAAIFLVLFGLVPAVLAVGGVTALMWAFWRVRSRGPGPAAD